MLDHQHDTSLWHNRLVPVSSPGQGHASMMTVDGARHLSLQLGGIIIIGDATNFPNLSNYNRVAGHLETLRWEFPEFDDLEDENHDGDADEEYLHLEDIDEPVVEYME